MSLVEAAKALATIEPIEDSDLGLRCMNCHASWRAIHPKHDPSCPWLALPKIVAALEAAERLREDYCNAIDELMRYRTSPKIGKERHQLLERIASRAFYGDSRAGILDMEQLRAALRGEP